MSIKPSVDSFYKDNSLIRMMQIKTQMNVQQQRFLNAVIASVQEKKKKGELQKIEEEGELEFEWDKLYLMMLQGSNITKMNRNEIKTNIEALLDMKFLLDIESSTRNEIDGFVLFQRIKIDFLKNHVLILLGKAFRVETLLPTAKKTLLVQSEVNKLSSHYARSLYEYFLMLIGKDPSKPFRTDIYLDVEYLRSLLGVNPITQSSYFKNTSLFINKCIKPAVDQINSFMDMVVSFEIIKHGSRQVNGISFSFMPNSSMVEKTKILFQEEKSWEEYNTLERFKNNDVSKNQLFQFRQEIVTKYRNKPVITGLTELGFSKVATIFVNQEGYLEVDVGKQLKAQHAIEVFEWLFQNQHRIGDVYIVDTAEKLNYIYQNEKCKIVLKSGMDDAVFSRVETVGDKFKLYVKYAEEEILLTSGTKQSFTEKEIIKYMAFR